MFCIRFPWRIYRDDSLWMTMVPEYREQGLDALIYDHIAQTCFRKGYQWVDLSLTSDDNPMTNKMTHRIGAVVDKRYRVYELALESHGLQSTHAQQKGFS